MYGEGGISVHVTDNNEEVLIGAPGVMNWKGTVIRYRQLQDIADVPNPDLWYQDEDSYFGYAVTSGQFFGPDSKKILYVASAPRANLQQGEVSVCCFFL